jgi:single-stranded DNA-binding protein
VMDGVNYLVVSGTIERHPSVRWREDGTCVCIGSLRIDERSTQGTVYKTFVPFEAYVKVAETVGERHAGDVVLLQGKIFWWKYHTKNGVEKNGLALLVSRCSLLMPMAVAVEGVHA